MVNICYKKGFVFVILVVFLLTVPSTLATFNPTVVKTLKNIKSVDKPDLVIQDAIFEWHYLLWHSYVVVLNQGTANVHGYQGFAIRIVLFRLLTQKKTLDDIYRFGGGNLCNRVKGVFLIYQMMYRVGLVFTKFIIW